MATDTQREKRRVILRAAITVFARHGYHTSRVADVAAEAGVAYGLVYHYFGSKEELLETIFRRTWTRMLEAVQEVERSGCRRASSSRRWRESCSEPGRRIPISFACSSARSHAARSSGNEVDEVEHAFAALERIVVRGQEQGELGPISIRASRR